MNSENLQVHSFGINDNVDWKYYTKLDIRSSNFNLIHFLKEYALKHGYPDLMTFSPPCESWSICDNQRRCYRTTKVDALSQEVVLTFFNQIKYDELNEIALTNKQKYLQRDFYKQYGRMLVGLDTIGGVFNIITNFNVDWVIENPQTSKIWEYIRDCYFNYHNVMYLNKAHYNNYNKDYTSKPTIFLSNKKLDLKHKRICDGKTITFSRKGSVGFDYNKKSSIPIELVTEIWNQLKN